MPITRPEAEALAEFLSVVRPNWTVRGIMAALGDLAKHPAPLEVITWAAVRCARNPSAHTPAIIPLNGPHWDLAERPPEPRLTPELECRRHVGKWAGNCGECQAERLEDPTAVPPPKDDGLSHLDPKARIREATARAKRVAHTVEAEAEREHPDHDPHTAAIRIARDREPDQEGDTADQPDPTGSTPTSTAPPNTPHGTTSDTPNAEA